MEYERVERLHVGLQRNCHLKLILRWISSNTYWVLNTDVPEIEDAQGLKREAPPTVDQTHDPNRTISGGFFIFRPWAEIQGVKDAKSVSSASQERGLILGLKALYLRL